jgi:hypothetical protein
MGRRKGSLASHLRAVRRDVLRWQGDVVRFDGCCYLLVARGLEAPRCCPVYTHVKRSGLFDVPGASEDVPKD